MTHTEKVKKMTNNKNVVSHTVTQVKVVKVKKRLKKKQKTKTPHLPPPPKTQPPQCPKICIDHYSFCPDSPSPSLDYLSICQCLMLLNEPKSTANILGKILCSENH